MSVRIGQSVGSVIVPDTVDELVTDVQWLAACDQVRAALPRAGLSDCGGSVSTELAAERFGGAR